jgi:cytoskeletal protein CcmA (bactofilin family)
MSLFKKLFGARSSSASAPAKPRLSQLASAGPRLRGVMFAAAAGYFGCELDGDLHANDEVWIEPSGTVRGNLRGTEFSVEGLVRGDITASGEVALKTKSRVTGNVSAGSLLLESGALFNGLLAIGGDEKSLVLNLKSKS